MGIYLQCSVRKGRCGNAETQVGYIESVALQQVLRNIRSRIADVHRDGAHKDVAYGFADVNQCKQWMS